MTEFDIIKKYFATQTEHRSDVIHGIGDDAAVVKMPQDHELVITTDTLVSGIHFSESTLPDDIGYKSLAVNLSDLAAMGATPAWATMALTIPQANEDWIQHFCDGFFTLAHRYQVQLIGGDLTHGPLSITVQAMGFVPAGKAILRSGSKPADLIYVTGTIGDAGLALRSIQEKIQPHSSYQHYLMGRLNRPEPRVENGKLLRDIARAAIDISDGLAADLNHLLEESQVGAIIDIDQLPMSPELKHSLSYEEAIALALTAGDDYELCFTIPADKRDELEKKLSSIPCRFTYIGKVTEQPGLNLCYQDGRNYNGPVLGYQHF